jgi:pyruvyl transferase EpsO
MMAGLSSQIDICLSLLNGDIVYLDYPVYCNIGDLLIWMGTKEFLKRNQISPIAWYSVNNTVKRTHNLIERCDVICFQGGGNLGDLWPRHQKLREKIIQQYPLKRIVVLPQSVHFTDVQQLNEACSVFRTHPDLHIFVRDRNSLSLLQDRDVRNVKLCPDMAHALWGRLSATPPTKPDPLYLLRRDKEAAHLPGNLDAAEATDWEDLLTGWTKRAYELGVRVNEADGGKGNNFLPAAALWNVVSLMLVNRAVALFAPYNTIVTNRLHAVILAALLGRKSVVYDNSYGKLSSYLDCWMHADLPQSL